MSWFDEQIKQRAQNDDSVFRDAFAELAGAVMGKRAVSDALDESRKAKNAIERILKYYHLKIGELPDNISDINDQLEFLMRPHGLMRRTVNLEKGWYKDAVGAMLAFKKDGGAVALIPGNFSGYRFFDEETGKYVKITRKNENLFETEAIAFYKPFPLKKIGIPHLFKYIIGTLSVTDLVLWGAAALAVTLVGMLMPKINALIFSDVIESGSMRILLAISVFLACVTVSSMLLNSVKALLMARIETKMSLSVQAATMSRILSLPASFFKEYSSGELAGRSQYINALCSMIVNTVLSTGISSLFSLVYITQIFKYTPALVIPAICVIVTTAVFSAASALVQMKISKKAMELGTKENGMSYSMISGVQKIKLAGAEKRVFARWGSLFAKEAELEYNPPMFIKINPVIGTAIGLVGTIIMYYSSVKSGISVSDYYAFNVAYGMLSGAFMSLTSIALTAARFKPILEMAGPLLKAEPEIFEDKQVVTRLSGGIELNNVTFHYTESMPNVLDDISLKIRPGQYVAIVGETGCGKSTLMRILLGFEKPQKGAVYYDGKDIQTIDLKSLRRKMGVVMQDGKLFQGDIFSNITVSAPWLTLDEAWEAAELAGIADDIRSMPMGMHTIISGGAGGISGGQRQRLMIARAVAPKPRILMFDEATSALDNITQKKVSESLDKLKCTRIVIAHRLSTIKQCDRIIFLESGKIVEDGTYDELTALNGKFAELVERQRLDV